MSASTDLVALSLLPLWWRRAIGDRLRAGHAPGPLLEALIAEHPHNPDLTLPRLRRLAATTLDRATLAGAATVGWSDPSYPPFLAAIVDPPPVLWIRGQLSAFEPPAVAIVGSRAGSSYALAVAERRTDRDNRGHTAMKYVHSSCRDGVEVVLWKLAGAGHVWPGGKQKVMERLLGPSTDIIDANREMWNFFSRFSL